MSHLRPSMPVELKVPQHAFLPMHCWCADSRPAALARPLSPHYCSYKENRVEVLLQPSQCECNRLFRCFT